MKRVLTILAISAACLAWTTNVTAQGRTSTTQNKTQSKPATPVKSGQRADAAFSPSDPVFTLREVAIITGWFREHRGHLPPGLATRESLPPGLVRQIQRNAALPPGLDKKMQRVPEALERQLISLPTGYRRLIVGADIIIVNGATGMVIDIVRDVVV